jgi:UDP-N-acetyl-D-galactosamine dehydrogenase
MEMGKNALESKVLVMGATFKENVSDIRNSKVIDIIRELESFSVHVDIIDPHADSAELQHEYGQSLVSEAAANSYEAIIIAEAHNEYLHLPETHFKSLLKDGNGVLVDIKGTYRNQIKDLPYWSL